MKYKELLAAAAGIALLSVNAAAYETVKSESLRIWFDDVTLLADGETVTTLTIYENDVQDYTAFNMALVVPEGIRIAKVKRGRDYVDDISLTERASSTHSIACNMLADGRTIKIISDSSMLDDFYHDDEAGDQVDALFTIGLIADKEMESGSYPVELWDVKFVLSTADASVPASLPVTGVFTVRGSQSSEESVTIESDKDSGNNYDLLGRKAPDSPEPGIYIRNGEKFIVK